MEESSKESLVVGAGALCIGVALGYYLSRRRAPDEEIEFQRELADDQEAADGPQQLSEEIVLEQLSRNIALYGVGGVDVLRQSLVVVVGCGGVGSHAAAMLMRSGVGRLRLIDFDQVTVSTLNRHAVCTRSDVGLSKVDAMKAHFERVMPNCRVEVVRAMFSADNAQQLLLPEGDVAPSYVIDCIDNTPTKAELIRFCCVNELPIVCSMGAGARVDPTKIRVCRLDKTFEDPLARTMRTMTKRMRIGTKVPCVFSIEKPISQLVELENDQAENPDEYQVMDQLRVRIMPVIGTIPAAFGTACATYVINDLSWPQDSDKRPIYARK